MNDLRARAIAERRARGWSIRTAAANAGPGRISNTAWAAWENGKGELTPKIQTAVALSFGWNDDWADHPPTVDPGRTPSTAPLSDLTEEVHQLASAVNEVREQLTAVLAVLQTAGALPPGEVTRQKRQARKR